MDEERVSIGFGDAMIVVDAQNDFILPDGALYVTGVAGEDSNDDIIKKILGLWPKFNSLRATTEDCHTMESVELTVFPPHCIENTDGQEYHRRLDALYRGADENLIKGKEADLIAYSVATSRQFFQHISNLRYHHVKRVFLCGWAFTHCVGESAIAYATQGFETYVIRDATCSVPPPYGNPETMTKKLELYGVKLIETDQIF